MTLLEGCNERAMLSSLSAPLKTVSWSSVYVKSTCLNPLPALGLLILSALFISIGKARALPDQLPIKLVWKIHALLGYKPLQKAWLEDYCDQEPNVWKLDRKKTNTHQALTKLKILPSKLIQTLSSLQLILFMGIKSHFTFSLGLLTCVFLSHL